MKLYTSVAAHLLFIIGTANAAYMDDKSALEHFFNISGGSRWINSTKWNDADSSVCAWFGISCDDADRVISISLPNNNLVGHLPKQMYRMEYLTNVDVKNNVIRDASFWGFAEARDANAESKLQVLELADNSLTTVTGIGAAPSSLRELHLTGNMLKGTIPAELFNLTSIEVLYLSYNQYTGTLPTEIGNLQLLERFYLYDNDLSGPIPSELGLLKKAQIFTLAENRFEGSLPHHVADMVNLRTFSVHNNEEQKGGLTGLLPSFDRSPYLTMLKLDGNSISGTIPFNFMHSSNVTDEVITVGLSGNRLIGTLPTSLLKFSSLILDVTGNRIETMDPLFCKKGAWMSGMVEDLGCDALLCSMGTWNVEGRKTETSDCLVCPSNFKFLGATSCNGTVISDEIALLKLYETTDGEHWNDTTGWNQSDVCQYYGVKCNDGKVETVELKNNGLVGTIPSEMFSLANLKILDLSLNAIEADLSDIANSKALERINLSGTKLSTIAGIESAPALTAVYLDALELPKGPFPIELLALSGLQLLQMQFSGVTGTLPTAIGKLSKLKSLHLYNNGLTGNVPSELGLLSDLTFLELSENGFSGSLPTELDGMTSIQVIHLNQATVKAAISGALPAFDKIPALRQLTLNNHQLEGTIPVNFLNGIENKSAPLFVSLAHNQLSGPVPTALDVFSELDILLEDNSISAIDTSLCNKSQWMKGIVKEYGCDAILCPPKTFNAFGRRGQGTFGNCSECASASFYGSIKCEGVAENKEKRILDSLFHSTGGPHWKVNTNWTLAGVPICHREGITCADHDADSGVTEVVLASNNLNGVIPREIFNLPDIKLLSFTDDQVDLSFEMIGSAQTLKVLKLSNTNLRSLTGISNASVALEELHVAGNQLNGTLPHEIFDLVNLEKLFLNNNMFTGTIPSKIGLMTSLIQLSWSSNMLTGEIPSELGKLSELSSLSLEQNYLSGNIPSTFDSLKELAVLRLDDQKGKKLSGPLWSFSTNSALLTLSLDDNDFSGTIPRDFLDSVPDDALVRVFLRSNKISGTVPEVLSKFSSLYIDLADNEISDLPDNFCAMSNWMDNKVSRYACNAILCPPGYFANSGKQVDESEKCKACPFLLANPFYGATECKSLKERDVLIELYSSLNGTNWVDQTNWLVKEDHCTWYGIVCSNTSISEINMEFNGLMALYDVSSLIFNLANLEKLDLKGNQVPLDLTKIPNKSKLRILMLSSCGLQSTNGIGNAADLRRLHLVDNALSGTFPLELLSLKKLRTLYLSFNSFSGTLPTQINQLSNLEEFYAYQNMLNGTLPNDSIAGMTNLKEFIVANNYFEGPIPTAFNSMSKLEQLSLFDQLSATSFSGSIPDFVNSPNLWFFDASNNELSGTIPADFMKNSVNLNRSVAIYLSNNKISGTVPGDLERFDNLDLLIVGNTISKLQDSFCTKTGWMGGLVKLIGSCDAIACPPGTYTISGRQESPTRPCQPCSNAANFYGSNICEDVSIEKATLVEFFRDTGGNSWESSTNWNSDEPICSWEGITCDELNTDDVSRVSEIKLENNNLVGTVPTTIWSLPFLKSLNVQDNSELHVSFNGLASAKMLEVLYLSAVRVRSLLGISGATKLKNLHLTGCNMNGPFPLELTNLGTSLEGIFIAFNSFTGTLPSQIGNLVTLNSFFAYDNEFSGGIPTEIGLMTNLVNFVASENLISGVLPTEVSTLANLQLFSVYRIEKPGLKLWGPLPSFNDNPQLTDLYLEGNSLTGNIPTDFLKSSIKAHLVTLGRNALNGTVPRSLGALDVLSLELEDNMITGFPGSFCNKTRWMDGAVASHGCDGFLCRKGYYSEIGRTDSNRTHKCTKCLDVYGAEFYGSTSCDPLVDQRVILMKLFQKCGGTAWNDNTGWTESESFCEWYGVECEQDNVVGLYLGSNNLILAPPPEVFNLPRLRTLELYSNPIQFEFTNIESATELTSLRLDSTGLTSVKGISKGLALSFVDMRFNSLSGEFSSEFFKLKNLRYLNLGNNNITGTIPGRFNELPYLKSLRLGNNLIGGKLHTFVDNAALTTIDLSDNLFTGSISRNFFESHTTSTPIHIDLSGNQLTGWIPGELDRFKEMTLYLRNNQISDIPRSLCEKGEWNNGDVGTFGCNGILCPPGTYNAVGRERSEEKCQMCLDDPAYFGQTVCTNTGSSASRMDALGLVIVMFLVSIFY